MTDFLIKHIVREGEQVEDPQVRERCGQLSGGIGIVLNLLLSAGKFFAGVVTSSIAVTADAFNNLSDAGSSVVTLVGFRLAGQRADDDHPFGHGRIEYLAGLLVSLIILLVGVELGKSSLEKILHPEPVDFSPVSVVILIASICVKLWMYAFNRSLSRRIGSAAMAATATDSLSDVVATTAVLVGTLIGHFADIHIDGWIGILVALFILRAGWGAAKDTLNPLLGQSPDPQLVHDIRETILAHPQVVGIHDMVIHDYGPGRRMMSVHAEVPVGADIMEVHDAIDHIEREIKRRYHIETSIHMDPIATDDQQVVQMRTWTAELVRGIDPSLTIHDFRMTHGPEHLNLIFDVVAPHSLKMSDEALRQAVCDAVQGANPRCFAVVQVDRSYVEMG